jgi:hypothetical protein
MAIVERCGFHGTPDAALHMSVIGTSVWTGRALQAGSDDLEIIGLALLYPRVERSRSWPSWISARIRSHSRLGPERPDVPPDRGCAGETVAPSPHSNSQTSAGISFDVSDRLARWSQSCLPMPLAV